VEIGWATRRHDNSGLVWSSRSKKLFLRDIQKISESGISKGGRLLVTRKRSFRTIESSSGSKLRSIKRRILVVGLQLLIELISYERCWGFLYSSGRLSI